MTTTTSIRVQKHRDALRQAGLRPVQLWVPDTRRPDFAAECRRLPVRWWKRRCCESRSGQTLTTVCRNLRR